MKKIMEINTLEARDQSGTWPGHPDWLEFVLTPAQLKFLEHHKIAHRRHPRRGHLQELFIDENALCDRDWTIIRLLF